jgi:hypothetical protein
MRSSTKILALLMAVSAVSAKLQAGSCPSYDNIVSKTLPDTWSSKVRLATYADKDLNKQVKQAQSAVE